MNLLVGAILTAGLVLGGEPEIKPEIRSALLAADRAFAKAVAERGLSGWMSFMAEDAARVSKAGEKIVVGKKEIEKHDAPLFANADRRLVWEPVDAHSYADGKHGATSGRYKIVGKTAAGQETTLVTGGYVTWWRKEADGQWLVIFDTGTVDPPEKK